MPSDDGGCEPFDLTSTIHPLLPCDRPTSSAREHRLYGIVVRQSYPRGEANDTDCAYYRRYGCRFGMRNDAQDPDLPRRVGDRVGCALSATPAASTTTAAAADSVPEWKHRSGRHGLSSSTASAAAVRSAAARESWRKGLKGSPDRLSSLSPADWFSRRGLGPAP